MARKLKHPNFELRPPLEALPQTWTPDDIYENASVRVIEQCAEDQRVERKPAGIDPRQLGDYFSIYANRHPHGGVVFVGVADDGTIEGCSKIGTSRIDKLEQCGNTYCPEARYESKRVPVYNAGGRADFVLAFRIAYRTDKLVENTKGEAWTRLGSSRKKLSETEKREIRINKREISFETEDVPLDWPDAFDRELVQSYVASFAARRQITPPYSDANVLTLSHLGRVKGQTFIPNIACALLFAKDPRLLFPGSGMRFLRFEGEYEKTGSARNEIADVWIDGPIPRLIAKAETVIEEQLKGRTRLSAEGRFSNESIYPKNAWREAIVNAFVHRSYNLRNMMTYVRMFDDKITVESPGGFPPPTTARTVYDSHNPRNPFLMEALFYLDFVKCAHEGARRMRDLMLEAGLPEPEFSEVDLDGYLVRVTLRGPPAGATVTKKPQAADADHKVLSNREEHVIAHIGDTESISVSEAVRMLQVNWRTAKKVLDGLVHKGWCQRRSKSGKARDSKARYFPTGKKPGQDV